MENEHKHHVVAWWTSGQAGIAKSDSAPNAIHFTAPPEFGGLEGRWTPEDLLMTALASCFTTTFHTIAGRSKSNTRTWLWKRKEPSVKRTMAIASARLSFVPA